MNTKRENFRGIIQYGSYITNEDIADYSAFTTIQAAPLDGTVFFALDNDGQRMSDFCWRSGVRKRYEDYSGALSDVLYRHSIGWGTCEQNFIHLANYANSTPPDWFSSEMDQIIENVILFGRIAGEMGVGLWYDFEPYGASIWQYNLQTHYATKSFAEYEAQVREIATTIGSAWKPFIKRNGFRLMSALAFDAYADTLYLGDANPFGLTKAWLNGLYDGLGGGVDENYMGVVGFYGDLYQPRTENQGKSLILTSELSYSCQTAGCIQNTIDRVDGTQGANYRSDSDYYQVIDEYGCALWIDYDTFNNSVPASNWFTPALFKEILRAAIDRSHWVWIYNQQVKFYGTGTIINSQYTDAIRECRREKGLKVW